MGTMRQMMVKGIEDGQVVVKPVLVESRWFWRGLFLTSAVKFVRWEPILLVRGGYFIVHESGYRIYDAIRTIKETQRIMRLLTDRADWTGDVSGRLKELEEIARQVREEVKGWVQDRVGSATWGR